MINSVGNIFGNQHTNFRQTRNERIERINNAVLSGANNDVPAAPRENNGILDMSPLVREKNERMEQMQSKMESMRQDLDAAREAAQAEAEYWKEMRIAMEIARRIMRGDEVPPQDESFLAEKSPGLYKLATSLRDLTNDDPEKHDSLLESDRAENMAEQITATMGASSAPAPMPSAPSSSAPSSPSTPAPTA